MRCYCLDNMVGGLAPLNISRLEQSPTAIDALVGYSQREHRGYRELSIRSELSERALNALDILGEGSDRVQKPLAEIIEKIEGYVYNRNSQRDLLIPQELSMLSPRIPRVSRFLGKSCESSRSYLDALGSGI